MRKLMFAVGLGTCLATQSAQAWYLPPPVAVPYGFTVSPRGYVWQNYQYVQPPPQPYAGGAVQQGLDPDQYNASHGAIARYGCTGFDGC